jgi:hypothetical protein
MKECPMHFGTSCKITAPTDKNCGIESKIRMTSQNYRFFQLILPIFQFLIDYRTDVTKLPNSSLSCI